MKHPMTMELAKSAVEALIASDLDPDLIPDVSALIEELHEDGFFDKADHDELQARLEKEHGRKR